MQLLLSISVALLLVVGSFSYPSGDIDVPSNVHNRSIVVKGIMRCGNKPFAGARVRLFRVYQKDSADDLAQLLDSKLTLGTGIVHLEGNTGRFPSTQTEIDPYLTIHHNCGVDEREAANKGYKRWAIRIPEEYVTLGIRPRKTFELGVVNLELEYPGEKHDIRFKVGGDQ